jgi:hypothetical protein
MFGSQRSIFEQDFVQSDPGRRDSQTATVIEPSTY